MYRESFQSQLFFKKLGIQPTEDRLCKPFTDEIDRVMARHYGPTDEESDSIITRDIKCRIGRDAGLPADEAEEEE
jgi:hypothetical protein